MRAFTTDSSQGGKLAGWVRGSGTPVVLLHGGPGLSFEILEELADEIGDGFQSIAFQQRGLAPSTTEGPFTINQAIDDVLAVFDHLELARPLLVGHSWGGHLALRVTAAHGDRVRAVVAVDPAGITGDCGLPAFEAEINARTPKADRERAAALNARLDAGEGGEAEAQEMLSLMWGAYFADPHRTLPVPEPRFSLEANTGLNAEVTNGLDAVATGLVQSRVRYTVVAGGGSPMPWGQAAQATVDLSPHGSLQVAAGAGHFPWFEAPGCVRRALVGLAE